MVGFPNNHWFSYEKGSFWGVLGVPPFTETPIWQEWPMAELLGFAFLIAKAFLVLSPLTLLPQK